MLTLFHFEVVLLIFLYLEPPGPLTVDLNLRTISDTLILHPGFATAAFLCVYLEIIYVVLTSRWIQLSLLVSFIVLVSLLGCIVYGPSIDPNHLIFASGFFISTLVLTTLRYLQYMCNLTQLVMAYITFFVLVGVAYFWPHVLGPIEIVYVYFVLNSWVKLEKASYIESLLAKLYFTHI